MISLPEARETVYWLRIFLALQLGPKKEIENLRNEAEQIARILGAFVVKSKPRLVFRVCSICIVHFDFCITEFVTGVATAARYVCSHVESLSAGRDRTSDVRRVVNVCQRARYQPEADKSSKAPYRMRSQPTRLERARRRSPCAESPLLVVDATRRFRRTT